MIRDIYIKGYASGGGGSVGATLMKTGQTTSFRTGDDGDLEAGRDVDFFTLPGENPFGNRNRFTDELGGQDYINNIVIDWSTYNGSSVLGWNRLYTVSNQTWENAIALANAFSVSTFITGWRLSNVLELFSIYNFGLGNHIIWFPLNITSTLVGWTSTTNPANASQAFYSGNSTTNVRLAPYAKVNNRNQGLYCRTFTVTGTILT